MVEGQFITLGPATFTEDNVALGNRRYEVRAIDKADNFSAPAVVNVFVGVVDNPLSEPMEQLAEDQLRKERAALKDEIYGLLKAS